MAGCDAARTANELSHHDMKTVRRLASNCYAPHCVTNSSRAFNWFRASFAGSLQQSALWLSVGRLGHSFAPAPILLPPGCCESAENVRHLAGAAGADSSG